MKDKFQNNSKETVSVFTREDTAFAKGIAILCMLFHHAIPNICYKPFFMLEDATLLTLLASSCKVCVALLTILSGYGLAEVYRLQEQKTIKNDVRFVFSRYVQLVSLYFPINFLVFLAAVLKRILIDKVSVGGVEILCGILGLKQYVGDWYLFAIIILYTVFPLVYIFVKRFRIKAVIVLFLPWIIFFLRFFISFYFSYDNALFYLFAFGLGIYLSIEKKLHRLDNYCKKKKIYAIFMLIICIVIRQFITLPIDTFVALAILYNLKIWGCGSGIASKCLRRFGKESSNMWLLQYTILGIIGKIIGAAGLNWMMDLLRFFLLCIIGLMVSIILNMIKDTTRFNSFVKKLRKRIL